MPPATFQYAITPYSLPAGFDSGDKKLRAIGIRSCISHGNYTCNKILTEKQLIFEEKMTIKQKKLDKQENIKAFQFRKHLCP